MNKHEAALKEEVKNRGRIYYHIYRELAEELGEERAVKLLKRAVYQRGREKGVQLAGRVGEPDLHRLAKAFMEGKEEMDVFGHEVVRVEEDHALLRLNACPLVEAWQDMGLSPEEIREMCDFAYQVDFGKFETAGYGLRFRCRIAEGDDACELHITKRSSGK